MRILYGLALTAIAATPIGAAPQQPPARPEVVTKLVDCRKIANDPERLRCFDQQVAAFDDAEQRRDVVVVDRAEIGRTRRSLFGLTLPSLKLFGGRDAGADQPEFTSIETTIKSAQRSGMGCWTFTVDDDARWVQADNTELSYTPKAGQRIRIRRGMTGNYLANVEKQSAIRVKRINGYQTSATGYCARM